MHFKQKQIGFTGEATYWMLRLTFSFNRTCCSESH